MKRSVLWLPKSNSALKSVITPLSELGIPSLALNIHCKQELFERTFSKVFSFIDDCISKQMTVCCFSVLNKNHFVH